MPITKNTAAKGYKKLIGQIRGATTEQAVTKISIVGQANASSLTPADTNNLRNSQFRNVQATATGWSASVGYTANYALYVHEAKGTLLGTATPRGKASRGNVWDPGAEPEFLRKGFEREGRQEIERILTVEYRI